MINITDPQAKQRVQVAVDRQITILERVHLRTLVPILNRQFIDSAALVRQGDTNIESQVDKQRRRMQQDFVRRFTRVNAVFGEKIFTDIDKIKFVGRPITIKGAFEEFQLNSQLFISQLVADRVVKVTKTTKKIIKNLISNGFNEGLSNREIAKKIIKAGEVTNIKRALRIARTETHTVAVNSMQEGVKSSRIKVEEEWVSSIDERTRGREEGEFKHIQTFPRGANGERIKQGDMFVGTGERLAFPGDPNGSAGNIIFCRCIEIFFTV